jgi:Cu(I)/Ag(I) efflux system membrane fusion protein
MKTVSRISIGFIVLLLLLGIATVFLKQATQTPAKLHSSVPIHLVGSYQIQIALNPEKPKIGNNQLTLLIRDSKDQLVTNAAIQAYAEMPAMGSMQAMREPVSIENSGSGYYQGHYSLPMNGSWPLTLTIESLKLGKADVVFDMNTSRSGVKLTQATPSKLQQKHQQSSSPKQQLTIFNVDSYRRQLIGVTTTEVISQKLIKKFRLMQALLITNLNSPILA